jgi:hypothetical protein
MLTDAFLEQDLRNKKYVEMFCGKFDVKLTEICITQENGNPEHAYTFSDDLGYYTIKGIKDSLLNK